MPFHRLVAHCGAAAVVAALLVPLDAAAASAATAPAFVPGGVAVVAGDGTGDGGPATAARLPGTNALAYAPDGDLVIGGIYRVRRVDAETGVITTVAGTGTSGTSADGGLATEAALERVSDVAVAPDGAVHVADLYAGRVRRVDPLTGTITTVAGGGSTTAATGVAATAAAFRPASIGFGPGGRLYVGARHPLYGIGAVWRVEADGRLTGVAGGPGATVTDLAAAPAGADWVVNEVADLTFTPGGDLVYSEPSAGRVIRVAGAGPGGTVTAVTTSAAGIHELTAAADGSFVVGRNHYGVQRLSAAGALTDVPGGADCGVFGLTLRANGGIVATCHLVGSNHEQVHAVPGDGTTVHLAGADHSPDGTPAAAAFFTGLRKAAAAPDGTVYFTERWRLRSIGTDGLLRTIAGQALPDYTTTRGDGGPAVDAAFASPEDVAVNPVDGSVYVLDGGAVRRIVPGGAVTRVIGGMTRAWTDGSPAAEARLEWIYSIAVDPAGVLYVADDSCGIAKVVDGAIYRVPGPDCAGPLTLAFDPAGRLVTGHGSGSSERVSRRAADGTWETLDRGGPRLAVRPDGSIETSSRSLRPDGARWAQSYVFEGREVDATVPLAAEPAGTLLAVLSGRLVRLTPAVQQPPAAVTGLTVTPGPGTITLGWDKPATAPFDYLVEIAPGTVPPPAPHLGRERAVALGNATGIILRRGGDGGEFPGLRAGETYAFAVYAHGPGGYSPVVTGTAVPQADATPPGEVTNLSVTYADNRLVATWTRPADDDLYSTRARLTSGTTPAASMTDGTAATDGGETSASWWIGSGSGTWTVRVFTADLYGNVGSAPATATFVRDSAPPPPVTGLRVTLTGERVVATWDAPAADVAQVRAVVSTTAYPTSPTSGLTPSSSTATSAAWDSPQYGRTYYVAVFTSDADGDTAPPTTAAFVPRVPATLTLSRSASTVTYGTHVTLRGLLTGQETGRELGGRRVELWRRAKGTTVFTYRAVAYTASDGRVAFSELPAAHMEYQLRHPPSAIAAANSAVAAVLVRAKVPVTPSSATARRGTAVHLYASVAPKHAGVPLTLKRYVGGVWRTVTTLKTGTTGSVRFTVAPATAGTYYYRVTFAGDAHHLAATSGTVRVAMT